MIVEVEKYNNLDYYINQDSYYKMVLEKTFVIEKKFFQLNF